MDLSKPISRPEWREKYRKVAVNIAQALEQPAPKRPFGPAEWAVDTIQDIDNQQPEIQVLMHAVMDLQRRIAVLEQRTGND